MDERTRAASEADPDRDAESGKGLEEGGRSYTIEAVNQMLCDCLID